MLLTIKLPPLRNTRTHILVKPFYYTLRIEIKTHFSRITNNDLPCHGILHCEMNNVLATMSEKKPFASQLFAMRHTSSPCFFSDWFHNGPTCRGTIQYAYIYRILYRI